MDGLQFIYGRQIRNAEFAKPGSAFTDSRARSRSPRPETIPRPDTSYHKAEPTVLRLRADVNCGSAWE